MTFPWKRESAVKEGSVPSTPKGKHRKRSRLPSLGPELGWCLKYPTVPELVQGWLERGKARWAVGTYKDYETVWRLSIAPALGKVRLSELTCQHLNRLYAAMGDKDTSALDSYERKLRGRLQQARAESTRKTPWRPSSPGRIHKVHAVIRSALTHACKAGLLAHNPAQYVTLPRVPYRRALVWTPERTESWRRTGEKPSAVMAWTEGQAGWFLDQIKETEYRDHSLFHLALTRGPRCQEVLNLKWRDLSLEGSGSVAIHGTKTPRIQRTISLGKENVAQLRKWRKAQKIEREKAGKKWVESDYVFTNESGKRMTRHQLRDKFTASTKKADLPPSLSAGTSLKVISKMLGHRNYKFAADTYVHVMPKCDEAAAEAVTRVIPRLAA